MRGGGLQTSFLQKKARATAAGSPNGSNEDDTTACLVFLVYLFADLPLQTANESKRNCVYMYVHCTLPGQQFGQTKNDEIVCGSKWCLV